MSRAKERYAELQGNYPFEFALMYLGRASYFVLIGKLDVESSKKGHRGVDHDLFGDPLLSRSRTSGVYSFGPCSE